MPKPAHQESDPFADLSVSGGFLDIGSGLMGAGLEVLVCIDAWERARPGEPLGIFTLQDMLGWPDERRPELRTIVVQMIEGALVRPARFGRVVMPRVALGLTESGRKTMLDATG